MPERRSLIDGINSATVTVDKAKEREFVFGENAQQPLPQTNNRVPISTRMREDFFRALKRASLERQLAGIEPNTLIDIIEEALEPWLKAKGYLS